VPYVERYFADIGELWDRRTSEVAQNVVVRLFPTWSSTITRETYDAATAFLDGPDVPGALRRLVIEGRADVQRALTARDVDRAAG
jgi:aminopeptidase N